MNTAGSLLPILGVADHSKTGSQTTLDGWICSPDAEKRKLIGKHPLLRGEGKLDRKVCFGIVGEL
jgi:hypothetical protein